MASNPSPLSVKAETDVIVCVVCKDGTSDTPNEIILCDSCNVGEWLTIDTMVTVITMITMTTMVTVITMVTIVTVVTMVTMVTVIAMVAMVAMIIMVTVITMSTINYGHYGYCDNHDHYGHYGYCDYYGHSGGGVNPFHSVTLTDLRLDLISTINRVICFACITTTA